MQDALTSYSGEKFDISWEDSLNVFRHIYSKKYSKKKMKAVKKIGNIQTGYWEAFMEKGKDDYNEG